MEIEEIDKVQDLTYELMTAFHSGLSWLVRYCERNNLPLPDMDKARTLITTSSYVLEHSEFTHQPKFNTDNDQPPNEQNLVNGCCYLDG